MDSPSVVSETGGRILNLEIRGLEEYQYLRTLVHGVEVSDLVEQLKRMIPELIEAEDIKVYQGKYLILKGENLNLLNIKKDVIVTITKKQNPQEESKEYIEEIDDMRFKIEDGAVLMNDELMTQMSEELRTREEICKQREERTIHEENLVNKMKKKLEQREEELKLKELDYHRKNLQVKYAEAKYQQKEDELRKKVEFQNQILQDLEDKQEILNQNQKENQREKEILQKSRIDLNCRELDLEQKKEKLDERELGLSRWNSELHDIEDDQFYKERYLNGWQHELQEQDRLMETKRQRRQPPVVRIQPLPLDN